MKPLNWRILVGIILVVMGLLALLEPLNIVNFDGSVWGIGFAILFAGFGAGFLVVLLSDRQQWWAAIPGCTLLGLGALIGLSMIPRFPDILPPVIFLGSIGLSFWIVYLLNRTFWWAIIPGGSLLSIAAMIGFSEFAGAEIVGVLFLGLAATFALVALLPNGEARMTWPWIPSAILAVMGALFIILSIPQVAVFWPILLVLIGLVLVGRALLKK